MWVPHVSVGEAGNVPVRVGRLVGPWAPSLAGLKVTPSAFSYFLISFKSFANVIQFNSNKLLGPSNKLKKF
jgi:hypothetical protein